ncbi:MAG: hypothetical protein ABTQ32_08145 [Myxococcaceae bacterium]
MFTLLMTAVLATAPSEPPVQADSVHSARLLDTRLIELDDQLQALDRTPPGLIALGVTGAAVAVVPTVTMGFGLLLALVVGGLTALGNFEAGIAFGAGVLMTLVNAFPAWFWVVGSFGVVLGASALIANASLQKARQPEREALKHERDRLLRDATTPTSMTTLLEF